MGHSDFKSNGSSAYIMNSCVESIGRRKNRLISDNGQNKSIYARHWKNKIDLNKTLDKKINLCKTLGKNSIDTRHWGKKSIHAKH